MAISPSYQRDIGRDRNRERWGAKYHSITFGGDSWASIDFVNKLP